MFSPCKSQCYLEIHDIPPSPQADELPSTQQPHQSSSPQQHRSAVDEKSHDYALKKNRIGTTLKRGGDDNVKFRCASRGSPRQHYK